MATTSLRIPEPVHLRLQKVADREHRSMHSQILTYIERGLEQDENERDR